MTKIIFILLSLFLSTPCLAEHPCMQSLSSFPLTLILVFTPNVTNPFRSFRCPQQNYYNSQLISVFPVSPTTNPYGNLFPSNRLNILILLYHTLLKFIWRTNSLARPLMLPKPSSIYIYSFISYFPIQDSPLYTPPQIELQPLKCDFVLSHWFYQLKKEDILEEAIIKQLWWTNNSM